MLRGNERRPHFITAGAPALTTDANLYRLEAVEILHRAAPPAPFPRQQPRRGGGGRPDGTERRQGCSEPPTDCIFLFIFFYVFLSPHLLLTLHDDCYLVPASRVASAQRCVKKSASATAKSCVRDGRQATAAAHCDPVDAAGRDRSGKTKKKRRPAVAAHRQGDVQQSQQKAREEGFNDAETQRERRHFAAGNFQS